MQAQEDERIVRRLNFEGNAALDELLLRSAISTTNSAWFARSVLTRWTGLGAKRRFDETEFRLDVVRLIALYRQSGYLEVAIDTSVIRTERDIYITFMIDEGPPTRVDKISIIGTEPSVSARSIRNRLPLRVGQPFDRSLLQTSADSIATLLRIRGHAWPEVFSSYDVDNATRTARLTFEAIPGPLARIMSIEIFGAERIDTAVIRNQLSIRLGQSFDSRKLFESQRALYTLGTFRFVTIALLDSLPPVEADQPGMEHPVSVGVFVVEGPLRRIRVGPGFGTLDCFRLQTGWTARNFIGGGRTFDVTGQLTKLGIGDPTDVGLENSICSPVAEDKDFTSQEVNYNLTVSLRQPRVFSPRNEGSISFFAERRGEFNAYLRRAVGGNVSITRQLKPRLPVTFGYELSYGRTDADDVRFCTLFNVCREEDIAVLKEDRATATLALRTDYDRTDNVRDPRQGSRYGFETLLSDELIGSDPLSQFVSFLGGASFYHRVGRRGVFAWRLQAGVIFSTKVPVGSTGGTFVPLESRFYAGGPNSVRGFTRNELGPLVFVADTITVDSAGVEPGTCIPRGTGCASERQRASPTGGNTIVLGNVEYRFPFVIYPRRLRFAMFVDVGQVWDRGTSTTTSAPLRVTPGIGFRVATPLGPARLDIAWNPYDLQSGPLFVVERTTDPSGNTEERLVRVAREPILSRGGGFFSELQFHFSIGQAF